MPGRVVNALSRTLAEVARTKRRSLVAGVGAVEGPGDLSVIRAFPNGTRRLGLDWRGVGGSPGLLLIGPSLSGVVVS